MVNFGLLLNHFLGYFSQKTHMLKWRVPLQPPEFCCSGDGRNSLLDSPRNPSFLTFTVANAAFVLGVIVQKAYTFMCWKLKIQSSPKNQLGKTQLIPILCTNLLLAGKLSFYEFPLMRMLAFGGTSVRINFEARAIGSFLVYKSLPMIFV